METGKENLKNDAELEKLKLGKIGEHVMSKQQTEETLGKIELSQPDLEKLRNRKPDEISEEEKEKLQDLQVMEFLKTLKESERVIEKKNSTLEVEGNFREFLENKGLSQDLIKTLQRVGLIDEFHRFLKALDFTDDDIELLRKLWEKEMKFLNDTDFESGRSSSSEEDLSFDGIYLKNALSKCLLTALREIVAKKPFDPVEYLAHWLLHYRVCEEREKREKEFELELSFEREKFRKQKNVEDEVPSVDDEREEDEDIGRDWNYLNYEGL